MCNIYIRVSKHEQCRHGFLQQNLTAKSIELHQLSSEPDLEIAVALMVVLMSGEKYLQLQVDKCDKGRIALVDNVDYGIRPVFRRYPIVLDSFAEVFRSTIQIGEVENSAVLLRHVVTVRMADIVLKRKLTTHGFHVFERVSFYVSQRHGTDVPREAETRRKRIYLGKYEK